MITKLKVNNKKDMQILYSPNIEYHDYGNCKRHLQMLFPYGNTTETDKKFPLILFIPGSAWHKQEMYNDISRVLYKKLAETRHEAIYYELEGLDAHGGAVFYSDEVLGVVKAFCENSNQ